MTAAHIIELLGMRPHPEGGHYVETFRQPASNGSRDLSTAIYFLLQAGERSHWHRVDAVEVWHFHAGDPLELAIASPEEHDRATHVLGTSLDAGERPQVVVPGGWWQRAHSLGEWTLVGCTVTPGFRFEGFELAPEGWNPR